MTLSDRPLSDRTIPPKPMNRNLVIASSVVLFHVAALWALQTGLLRRAMDVIVPVEILSEFIEPPAPKIAPPPVTPPAPAKQAVAKTPEPAKAPAAQPVAIADPTPAPNAPTGVVTPQPPAPEVVMAAPVAAAAVAPPAPPKIELPSSDAEYLNNPKPPYPSISRRLREEGTVVFNILVGVDGKPEKLEIKTSSGFYRLDQAAYATVMNWRFTPGKRNGVATAMSYTQPVFFYLTQPN